MTSNLALFMMARLICQPRGTNAPSSRALHYARLFHAYRMTIKTPQALLRYSHFAHDDYFINDTTQFPFARRKTDSSDAVVRLFGRTESGRISPPGNHANSAHL